MIRCSNLLLVPSRVLVENFSRYIHIYIFFSQLFLLFPLVRMTVTDSTNGRIKGNRRSRRENE